MGSWDLIWTIRYETSDELLSSFVTQAKLKYKIYLSLKDFYFNGGVNETVTCITIGFIK